MKTFSNDFENKCLILENRIQTILKDVENEEELF